MCNPRVKLDVDDFDRIQVNENEFETVTRFTWQNANGMVVQVITYGATVTSIKVPDKNGKCLDVVMGFKDITGYQSPENPYFGATLGRVANRIGEALLKLDNQTYNVTKNHGKHHLHGGLKGFDKVNWNYNYCLTDKKVTMSYLSKDGEEGFPGDVLAFVEYEMTTDNKLIINFMATTSKPTTINMANHSYFNLAGHDSGEEELYKHFVCINADHITAANEDLIPTGKLTYVGDSVFDLRVPTPLSETINNIPSSNGYDHNFCINRGSEAEDCFVARVGHPSSGRVLEVYSNQPGVQFYTANFLPEKSACGDDNSTKLVGKGKYFKHGAFCLETQNYPNAVNTPNFPKAVYYPGEVYRHRCVYKFLVEKC